MVSIMSLYGFRLLIRGQELLYGVDINSYSIRIATMYRRLQQHRLMHRQLMDFHLLGLVRVIIVRVHQLAHKYLILSSSLKANWQFGNLEV